MTYRHWLGFSVADWWIMINTVVGVQTKAFSVDTHLGLCCWEPSNSVYTPNHTFCFGFNVRVLRCIPIKFRRGYRLACDTGHEIQDIHRTRFSMQNCCHNHSLCHFYFRSACFYLKRWDSFSCIVITVSTSTYIVAQVVSLPFMSNYLWCVFFRFQRK